MATAWLDREVKAKPRLEEGATTIHQTRRVNDGHSEGREGKKA